MTAARIRRPLFNFFQIASLVMILIAVALGSAIITMHFAIHGAEVSVPSLKGMTVAEARSQTSGLGLNLEVDNRYYSSDVAPGPHSYAIARPRNGGPPRMAGARGREPRSAEGRSAGYGRCGRTRGRAEAASSRTRGRSHGATPFRQRVRRYGPCAGSSGACARHRGAEHQSAGGRARRRYAGRICHARFHRRADRDRAGLSRASWHQRSAADICRCPRARYWWSQTQTPARL